MMNQEEARRIAKMALAHELAPTTIKHYERRAAALLPAIEQADGGISCALETLVALATEKEWSDSTFSVSKAAVQYALGKRLTRAIRELDQARKAGNRAAATSARREMRVIGAGLIGLHPDPNHERRNDSRVRRPYRSTKRSRARSKRRSVQELVEHGIGPLLKELPGKDRFGVLVLAISGARPAELRKGMLLRLGGKELAITIRGAKVSGHSGQPARRLHLDTADWAVNIVASVVQEHGDERGVLVFHETCDERWRSAFRRAAKRAGMPHVTPYSLRHWFSSKGKASGVDRTTLAAAMGHLSDRTHRNYGQTRYGTGGSALRSAEADRPVTHQLGWAEYEAEQNSSAGQRPS